MLFAKVNAGLLRSLSNEFAGVPVFAFFIIMWYIDIVNCTVPRTVLHAAVSFMVLAYMASLSLTSAVSYDIL